MFTFVITIFGHEFAIYLMFKFSHKLPKLNGGHTCNNDNLKLQRGGGMEKNGCWGATWNTMLAIRNLGVGISNIVNCT